MTFASIPVAWVAGVLGIASPCVWPLVPVVASAAAASGRSGLAFLALGLSTAFAVAGTVVVWLLLTLNLDPELFRYFAAAGVIVMGALLWFGQLSAFVTDRLSRLVGRARVDHQRSPVSPSGQFLVGALLGFVWLPCVGPTLGAAITVASLGQNMLLAGATMFSFGVGTACMLVLAGVLSQRALARWRPGVASRADQGRRLLAVCLVLLGVLVFTGLDRRLEAWSLRWLPAWVVSF